MAVNKVRFHFCENGNFSPFVETTAMLNENPLKALIIVAFLHQIRTTAKFKINTKSQFLLKTNNQTLRRTNESTSYKKL
jgi:hypothetical protein